MLLKPGMLTWPTRTRFGIGHGEAHTTPAMTSAQASASDHRLLDPSLRKLDVTGLWQAKARIRKGLIHIFESGHAPGQSNLSAAFALDKRNGKQNLSSLRLIHVFCPLFRAFYRSMLPDRPYEPPDWAFCGIRGRRLQHFTLSVRIVTAKLRYTGLAHAIKSYDMRSAFHSGVHANLCQISDQRSYIAHDQTTSDLYGQLLRDRRQCTVIKINGSDGDAFLNNSTGGPMGDSNEPEIFMQDFYNHLDQYRANTMISIGNPLICDSPIYLDYALDLSLGA